MVVTVITVQVIVTYFTIDSIVAAAPINNICTVTTINRVITIVAMDRIVTNTTTEVIRRAGAINDLVFDTIRVAVSVGIRVGRVQFTRQNFNLVNHTVTIKILIRDKRCQLEEVTGAQVVFNIINIEISATHFYSHDRSISLQSIWTRHAIVIVD